MLNPPQMDAEFVFRLILIIIAAIALVSIIMHYNQCIQRAPSPYIGPAASSGGAAGMETYADMGTAPQSDAAYSDTINPILIPARAQPPVQLSANEENIEELPALVEGGENNASGVTSGSGYGGALSSADLLPKLTPEAQQFAQLYPCGQGDMSGMNFLESGTLIGQSTNLKRNANLQLRSDPPIPYKNVSPWQMSTIRPDCYQRSFELGQS